MSVELSSDRQAMRETYRERVMRYIARTALHEVVGCYENDDDKTESKNG